MLKFTRTKLSLFLFVALFFSACGKTDYHSINVKKNITEDAHYKKWWRLIPFSNTEGKWGYRTRGRGKIIIPPRFDHTEPFLNKYAKVSVDGWDAWINLSGQIVFSSRFPVSEGLYVVKSTSWLGFLGVSPKYGYADVSGKYVIQPVFDNAYDFSEGLAGVRIDNKYGYINKMGEMVIAPRFIWAGSFSEGLAAVLLGDREGYINTHGAMVIPPRFIWADQFSEGLAAVLVRDKWGYVNTNGYMVINPEFEMAWPFFSGFAKVEFDGKYWYIDREGENVSPEKLTMEDTKTYSKITSDDIPFSFNMNYFKTSSNIQGYHPEIGLIFNARGWALSRTFHIRKGRYSLKLSVKGLFDPNTTRMMNISLVSPEAEEHAWQSRDCIKDKMIYFTSKQSQYQVGPWEIPGGSYKIRISLLNDPVMYTEQGEIIYDRDFYISLKNILISLP